MCYSYDHDDRNYKFIDTYVYAVRAILCRRYTRNITYQFEQYHPYYWYMESINYKYYNTRKYSIYIHTKCGTVCHDDDHDSCCYSPYNADVYTARTLLSKCYTGHITDKFDKYTCHNRYMESKYH